MTSVAIFDEDDADAAFQADLARAIAASLEPDAPGSQDDTPPVGGIATGLDSLVAAGAVARWGLGPSGTTRAGSSDVDSVRAGRCSPALLSSEEEEDADFQRQVAAAMEASLQSVEEDQRRRACGDGTRTGSGAGGGFDRTWGSGRSGGSGLWELPTSLPAPISLPALKLPTKYTSLASGYPLSQFPPQASQNAAAPPSSPTRKHAGPPSLFSGPVCCSSGLRLQPLAPAGCVSSPFALAAEAAAPAAASVKSAAQPQQEPSSHSPPAAAGAAAQAPSSQALLAARSAPLPSSPPLLPSFPATGATAPSFPRPGASAPPFPPPLPGHLMPVPTAALDPLSTSPGKHARTPSLAGAAEQVAPSQKRSRPASDSGVPPSPATAAAHAEPGAAPAGAWPELGPVSFGQAQGGWKGVSAGSRACEGAATDEAWRRSHSHSAPQSHLQSHSLALTLSPERPASAGSTSSGASVHGAGPAASAPGWTVTTTAAATTVTVAPPAAPLTATVAAPQAAPHAQRPSHTLLDLSRTQVPWPQSRTEAYAQQSSSGPGAGALQELCLELPTARREADVGQQGQAWQPDAHSWQPWLAYHPEPAVPTAARCEEGDGGWRPRPVAPPLDLSRHAGPAGAPGAAQWLAPTLAQDAAAQHAAPPLPSLPAQDLAYSAADRRLLLHQRVWWWLGARQAQPGRITSIDRRSEPLLFRVRLDGLQHGGGGGEEVMATADCLLPFVFHGERLMCRLPPPPPATALAEVEEEQLRDSGLRTWEEAERAAVAAGAPPPSSQSCCWVQGRLQHCVFDGPTPRVHVLLGPEELPYTLPYEHVVPVADAAEGSGSGGLGSFGSGGGGGSGFIGTGSVGAGVNTCMDIVPVL